MAYTIVKSDGSVLTTIADGTINTTSTSLGLPGRNFAGYGQALNTNFAHIIENFADTNPPPNPLRGQLWFNTNNGILYVCPTDGEANAQAWLELTATGSGGTTNFGEVSVSGDLSSNNLIVTNEISANSFSASFLSITSDANIGNAAITNANIGSLRTQQITSGSASTPGSLEGTWTVNGSAGGNALVLNGNLFIANIGGGSYGIKTDNYMFANGDPVDFSGTYSNSNVQSFLPTYNGNILTTRVQTPILTTGANTTSGTITGNWTLTAGSRLQATYADLAERYAADDVYSPGTVVEIGGDHEVTAVKDELSEKVFGVVSDSAAYLMNSGAGSDATHPPIAIIGRVQVKVTGIIEKGSRLVSAGNGIARAAEASEVTAFNTFGRALSEKTTEGEGFVEAVVMIR